MNKKYDIATVEDALAYCGLLIELGEHDKDVIDALKVFIKSVVRLGEGDWKKGMARLRDYAIEQEREYRKSNPVYAVFMELAEYENPLDALRPEDPVHQSVMRLILEGGHITLSTEEAAIRGNEILREVLYESAMQLRRSEPEIQPRVTQSPRVKAGRPHNPDDIWAWQQIHLLRRRPDQVFPEWLERLKADPKRMNNINPERQFSRIKTWAWGANSLNRTK